MVFNSVEDLMKIVENEAKKAMEYTAREMQKRIRVLILEEIYSVYRPEQYERTFNLLNSVEVVPIQKQGNEWIIEVRFKNNTHTNKEYKGFTFRYLTSEEIKEFKLSQQQNLTQAI